MEFGDSTVACVNIGNWIGSIVDINIVARFPTRITVAVDEDLGGLIDDGRECDGVLIFLASGHQNKGCYKYAKD